MPEPRINFAQFYPYAELRRQISALAKWKPELATLHKIGKSPGGRDLLLIEINDPATGRSEDKPAYFVHGNIHASEVSGSASALYLAHYLLDHAEDDPEVRGLLEKVAFYICPRISVDGAEDILVLGRSVRSRATFRHVKNRIWPEDLNGDGRVLRMRVPDPDGPLVALREDPRVLAPRRPEDEGQPRYRLVSEGLIHDWDGGSWQDAECVSYDFNRNWGVNWKPPHEQHGAGRYGFSEPEVRAVGDFVLDHMNIFGILGFHTGPAAVLRPPSTGGDDTINKADLMPYRLLGRLGADITGFPCKAIHEYHNEFGSPMELWGHFPDWGYKALGLFVFEIELGTLRDTVGFGFDRIMKLTDVEKRQAELACMEWHDAHPAEAGFVEWAPFDHPQLGLVEIGGWLPSAQGNRAPEERVDVWDRSRRFIFELAARAPRLVIRDVTTTPLADGLFRVGCHIVNDGLLPTSVTSLGARVADVDGEIVEVERGGEVSFVAGRNYTRLGHLAPGERREMAWVVKAEGEAPLRIIAHGARCGKAEVEVRL